MQWITVHAITTVVDLYIPPIDQSSLNTVDIRLIYYDAYEC